MVKGHRKWRRKKKQKRITMNGVFLSWLALVSLKDRHIDFYP